MSNPLSNLDSFISELTEDIDQTIAQAAPQNQEQALVGTQEVGPQVSEQVQATDTDTNTIGGAGGNASADGGDGGESFAIGGSTGDFRQDGEVNIAFDGNDAGDAASVGGAGGFGGVADASGGDADADVEVEAEQENNQSNNLDQDLEGEQDADADLDADNEADQEEEVEEIDV
ncbi:hypothetical protein FHX44_115411 [Pseudonocardia hierapolitana]|uniref:Uncharacterized protein n=1 Tax=Pseudonocardia hierapolitana TaxID=1128676 RepID=A0A561SX84_9PSEU|nr:hypothetical protein [Pseudonocardia hierapolitana]TWF79478.1 hypothetical protein FHX44_115411 [Pseudonocardia hierapolitana]